MKWADVVLAFARGQPAKGGGRCPCCGHRDKVEVSGGSVYYYLHDNLIAEWDRHNGALYLTDSGWPTPTTASRLSAILGHVVGWGWGVGLKRKEYTYIVAPGDPRRYELPAKVDLRRAAVEWAARVYVALPRVGRRKVERLEEGLVARAGGEVYLLRHDGIYERRAVVRRWPGEREHLFRRLADDELRAALEALGRVVDPAVLAAYVV